MRNLLLVIMLAVSLVSVQSRFGDSAEVQLIKEQEIRRVIGEFVKSRTDSLAVEANIKKIGYKGDLTLPAGQVDYEVKAPQQWEGWGSASLAVIVRVDGRVLKNIPVRVEVEALTDMVVTTRQMEQGEIIGNSDVAVQKRDLAAAGNKICRSIADVVGKRLKSSLRGNVPLRSDQLEKLPLIKSGQVVTILLENELIRVTATGRAKGAGAAGDSVIVQNLASQKDIQARVVDSATVKVEF
ncbi:flagellar basal body P-ring formation protein FlgA [Geobacter pelophilus]|uniref:Flagella basal body P-ring formation protein FlgA n=1 Tax=Geoanaerobacter pelophilus TaxID=60036 RepID=A0AAW4KZ74_9BACT|nr:flagellar basal body P-ring formation chaperone FlgA [Geoanaerobacter pelophilus]MBT0663948.1 flagellar basal body P-ring formation protein FlgA [Geoanaerobacter pelophilus]